MAGGPIFPNSAYPVTAGNCFPNFYVGGGAYSKQEEGMGVAAGTLSGDSTWRLRFHFPPTIPTGTCNLRLLALANASTGVAKYSISGLVVAAGSSPSGTILTALTSSPITTATWPGADLYFENKTSIAPLTPVGNSVLVMDITFLAAGHTLAQVSTWIATLIWE